MTISTKLLETAALFHLFQVPGTLYLAVRVACIRAELERLSLLGEAIVKVLGAAVVFVLVDLGVLIALYPGEVLATSFGRMLAGSLGIFWGLRLIAQKWYFLYKPWPRDAEGLIAHWALCFIFAVQTGAYLGAVVAA